MSQALRAWLLHADRVLWCSTGVQRVARSALTASIGAANSKAARASARSRYGKSTRSSGMVIPAASRPRTVLTVTRVSRMQGRPLIRFGSMEIRSYGTSVAYADRSPAAERTGSAPPIAICPTINGHYVDRRPVACRLFSLARMAGLKVEGHADHPLPVALATRLLRSSPYQGHAITALSAYVVTWQTDLGRIRRCRSGPTPGLWSAEWKEQGMEGVPGQGCQPAQASWPHRSLHRWRSPRCSP